MSDYKAPLNGKEALNLQYLAYLVSALKEDETVFKTRLSKIGEYWRFKGLSKQAENLYNKLRKTLPTPLEIRFMAILDMQKLYIVTKGGATDPTGDLTVVPRKALIGILVTASKECILCDGSHEDRRKCPYRRAIKDLSLVDLSKVENNGICLGKQFDWEANSDV